MNSREEERLKNNQIAAEFAVDETFKRLKRDGFTSLTLDKIRDEIYSIILTNSPYKELSDSLFPSDSYTNLIIEEITPDTFSFYNGAIQNTIKQKYNSTKGVYLNSLTETSRPFCIHMKETYGNKDITIEQLQKSLDEYCPNGIPSDKLIEIDGKILRKGTGMIEGTTVQNFAIYRGGHGCNHNWSWTIE